MKRKYYQQRIEKYEGDPKNLWKILKDITQTHTDKSAVEPEYMTQSKANKLNSFFATIGTEIQKSLGFKSNTPTISNHGDFKFVEETEETILKLIDRIRSDVATGDDNISAKLLQDAKFTIAESLTKLVNLSYSMKVFPDSMKKATIRPIHKKNCTTEDLYRYFQ